MEVANQTLKGLIDRFSTMRVMIVGDVMVDSYIWGKVSRISPEAPVPVVVQSQNEYRMGGAANVAMNVRSLGAEPILCSVVGADAYASVFRDLMDNLNLNREGILTSDMRATTLKTRVISGNQHLLRIDHESDFPLPPHEEVRLIVRVKELMENFSPDAIIFQDYDKGCITPGIIEAITSEANSRAVPVLVDPKKRNFNAFKQVTLFKPNFKELTEGLNLYLPKHDVEGIFNLTRSLLQQQDIDIIMVTLSEMGIFISDGEKYHVVPAQMHDIADVSGAGDTVISVAALACACGLGIADLAGLSNLAGGLVCQKVGVVPIDKELLLCQNFTLSGE